MKKIRVQKKGGQIYEVTEEVLAMLKVADNFGYQYTVLEEPTAPQPAAAKAQTKKPEEMPVESTGI